MISTKIINNLIIPYLIIFLMAGVFLFFFYKFLILRFPFLSLKIISGAVDWKGSKGKITPGRAFFSGVMGLFFPGTFMGLFFALSLSKPSIILLIILIHVLQTSIEYVLATSSFMFRARNQGNNLETGIILGLDKYSRVKWFGLLYGFLIIIISLLSGLWNLSLLGAVNYIPSENIRVIPFEPSSLIIFFIIFLILINNGEIRRIALYAKITMYIFSLLLLIIILFLDFNLEFYKRVFFDFTSLFDEENVIKTLYSLFLYMIFTEVPNIRLNFFAGYIRTDYAAKAGIASILAPIIQILFIILISGFLYSFIEVNGLLTNNYIEVISLFSELHSKYLSLFFKHYQDTNYFLRFIFNVIFILLLFSSFLSWFYIGNLVSKQLSRKIHIPNIYPTFAIILFLIFGFFINHNWIWNKIFFIFYVFIITLILIFSILFALLYHQLGKFELNKYLESYHGGIDLSRDFFILIFSILPSNLISKIFGMMSLVEFPKFLMVPIIKIFSKIYKINLEEVKKDLNEFKNLNEFFIRELKDSVRPIHKGEKIIVSPVDALLSKRGLIQERVLIQAKGIFYSLKDLLGDPDYIKYFENGKYCVLYLSPQDYHRIHTPFDCEVEGYTYSPGSLFPVNEPAVEGVYGLFPKNERLTTFLKTRYGRIAMVKVGATNVGKIRVMYDSIQTNAWIRRKKIIKYNHKIFFRKGMEIARFEMGSTVILVFEKDTMEFLEEALEGIKMRYGQPLAKFL